MKIQFMLIFSLTSVLLAQAQGSVVSWGTLNLYGECSVPPDDDIVAIASGPFHGLALKSDSTIVCWGDNSFGCSSVPNPNENFVAVAAGGEYDYEVRLILPFSAGLKADGSIVCWGSNYLGQCNVPYPNQDFVAISAGAHHCMGLKADSTVVCWGFNEYGQCEIPEPNEAFVAISAGRDHSLGLKADGSIVAWGSNSSGQCYVPEPNSDFISVAAGHHFSMGLKSDGSVVCWGNNYYGQCSVPDPNENFVAIAAGQGATYTLEWPIYGVSGHSLALRDDGSIIAWGFNAWGQCNVPSPNENYISIAAGAYHSIALQSSGTGLEESHIEASALEITSIFPNPFSSTQSVSFRLNSSSEFLSLIVFDLSGRIVHHEELTCVQNGECSFTWDAAGTAGRDLNSGVYLIRIDNGTETTNADVLFVK